MEIKNAVIESVTLEKGDRGFLQCWLHLSYGGSGQGFGGYVLYLPKSYSHHELKSFAGHFIFRCMEIAGVERWDQLQGRTICVRSEHHTVHAIGHIVKDDWFDPSADFDPKPAKCDGNHGGPRCCEKGAAAGVQVCTDCADASAAYQADMSPRAAADAPIENGDDMLGGAR